MSAEDNKKAVTVKVPAKDKETKDKKKDELNEDDLQLKADIELLVARLADSTPQIVANAIETLTTMLRTHSGSVASIPKPLKFVRGLFPQLETALASVKSGAAAPSDEQTSTLWRNNLRRLFDLLSFVAMTMDIKNMSQSSLSFKMNGTSTDLADWGHEYMRFLAGEIAAEWEKRVDAAAEAGTTPDASDLRGLQSQIVEFMLHHQDESTAIDLLIENEDLGFVLPFVDENNFHRIAQYIVAVSRYLQSAQRETCLRIACDIYEKQNSLCQALRIALILHDAEKAEALVQKCDNESIKLQMALICARSRLFLDCFDDNDLLSEANGNRKLPELFRHSAKELDALAPKAPADVYKTTQDTKASSVAPSSYMQNLANLMVSGLVNAGFGTDTLFTDNTAVYLTKDHRQMSATAALGLVHLWDESQGLTEVDKYSYADNPAIKGGAHLATGITLCGVKSQFDAAIGLLTEPVSSPHKEQQVGAILGLGLAYAGTRKEDVKELLVPILADSERPLEVQCMAAFACALVYPGTCNEDLVEACMASLMDKDEKALLDPAVRYLILALGCFFLGQQNRAETLLDAVALLPESVRRYTEVVVRSCAYAGTGNVLEIQRLFNIVAEVDEGDEDDEKKPATAEETAGTAPAAASSSTAAAEGDAAPTTAAAAAAEKKAREEQKMLSFKAAAVMGIGLVAMGEELGEDMARRSLIHVLLADTVSRSGASASGRRSVPLAYALLAISTANPSVIELLNRLSHDSDVPTAQNAILSMGLVAAGTNNARVATMLRALAQYYHKDKDSNILFTVRLAQGLTALGKGHLTLSPFQQDRAVLSYPGLVGILGLLHSALDFPATLLDRYHYMFYSVTPAINPRMILAVNEQFVPVEKGALVRVGIPVDTVTVAGRPKTITGFQTHSTPVLLSDTERAELAAGKHKTIATTVVEGIVVVEEKQLAE